MAPLLWCIISCLITAISEVMPLQLASYKQDYDAAMATYGK